MVIFLRVHEDRRKEELIGKEKQYVSLNAVVQTIVGTVEKADLIKENGILSYKAENIVDHKG